MAKRLEPGPYGIITADPCWQYRDAAKSGNRGAGFKYSTMTTSEIARLDVRRLAARDCALLLWAVPPMLGDALYVMREWGFHYSTIAFVWVKTAPGPIRPLARKALEDASFGVSDRRTAINALDAAGCLHPGLAWGMGQSTRANVEIVLLGTRGRLGRVSAGVHQVILAPPGRHSEKPALELDRRAVQLLGERKRIELFARTRLPGVDVWGNDPALGGSDVELLPREIRAPKKKRGEAVSGEAPALPDPRQLNLLELCRG
jgi:N6-adenosine-specific RNA methylase IME4